MTKTLCFTLFGLLAARDGVIFPIEVPKPQAQTGPDSSSSFVMVNVAA